MSASPPKADIARRAKYVGFVPSADVIISAITSTESYRDIDTVSRAELLKLNMRLVTGSALPLTAKWKDIYSCAPMIIDMAVIFWEPA